MAKKKSEKQFVFVPGNVPSLKNSKVKTSKGIFPSKTVMKYLREMGIQAYSASKKTVTEYKTRPNLFKDYANQISKLLVGKTAPYVICFHFVRKTKADFDFNNANQIILDLLTAHKVIEDDNMRFVIPAAMQIADKWYTVDKDKPGVWITVE